MVLRFIPNMIKYCIFFLAVFLIQCKTDEQVAQGSASLEFNALFDNKSFEPILAYPYAGKQKIKFSKFDFFITGIEFISTNTESPAEIGLIDFTSSSLASRKLNISRIKAGTYSGLRFIIGVKPELNKKLPKDFESTNPLASTSHYWDAWDSYIFSKIEGVVDTAGSGNFDLGFAIHTGTNDCLAVYEISRAIEIKENGNTSILFDLDIKKLFLRGNGVFDIISSPLNHNPANIETLKSFSSRMPGAIQIKN